MVLFGPARQMQLACRHHQMVVGRSDIDFSVLNRCALNRLQRLERTRSRQSIRKKTPPVCPLSDMQYD
jgi:hypothetical protein